MDTQAHVETKATAQVDKKQRVRRLRKAVVSPDGTKTVTTETVKETGVAASSNVAESAKAAASVQEQRQDWSQWKSMPWGFVAGAMIVMLAVAYSAGKGWLF